MKVLLSIKPEFAKRIFSGEKKYEYRKKIFKLGNVQTIVVYASSPVGMVIGEFEVDRIIEGSPSSLWKETHNNSGISKEFFDNYFEGRVKGYAIKIKHSQLYAHPKYISEIRKGMVPPQSFCYLED